MAKKSAANRTFDALPDTVVPLTNQQRAMLTWRANKCRIAPEAYMAAIVGAVVEDDRFQAVMDS